MRKKNHSITKDLNSSILFFLKQLTILLEIKHFFHDQLTVHLLENQFTQNCRTVHFHFLTPSSIYIVTQYSSLNNCSSEIRTHLDAARVLPCVVCTNKHLISKREKKRMLLKYIDGNMDVITHISEYYFLKEASTFNHFLTTRLQYITLKISASDFVNNKKIKCETFNKHPYIHSLRMWTVDM